MLFTVLLLLGVSLAQRPSDASICDYYAEQLYGSNSSDTQYSLIQSVISLAFGGRGNLTDAPQEITGILNPGSFEDEDVNLRPYFDGTLASTNLNNQGVQVDWLDGGGTDPLHAFLTGATDHVVLSNVTNQYRLFGHFFSAFSHVFGCSEPPKPTPSPGGQPAQRLSLAYVHKFMSLNHTQLGHFIDQVALASVHFGFSQEDADTFDQQLNSLYNVRCAPPISTSPSAPPQLLSLCQAQTCPLAAPQADCDAYVNLTASGTSSDGTTATAVSTVTFFPTSTPASSPTLFAPPAATSSEAPSSGGGLSSGGIAGVAVGGTVAFFILLGVLYFCWKRHRKHRGVFLPTTSPPYDSPQPTYASGPRTHSSHPSHTPRHSRSQSPYQHYRSSLPRDGAQRRKSQPPPPVPPKAQMVQTSKPHFSSGTYGGRTVVAEMESPRIGWGEPSSSNTAINARSPAEIAGWEPWERDSQGGGGGIFGRLIQEANRTPPSSPPPGKKTSPNLEPGTWDDAERPKSARSRNNSFERVDITHNHEEHARLEPEEDERTDWTGDDYQIDGAR